MPRTRTVRATALLAALTAITVTGCSGDPKPAPSTTTSSQPSTPSTSTTTSVPATSSDGYNGPASVPVAARAHTDAGRIAFAKHYVNQINETGKNPRTGILEPLALPTCKTCRNYSSTVSSLQRSQNKYTGDSFQILKVGFPQPGDRDVIELVCRGLRIDQVDTGKNTVKTYSGIERGGLVFYLDWQDGWKISKIKFDMNVAADD